MKKSSLKNSEFIEFNSDDSNYKNLEPLEYDHTLYDLKIGTNGKQIEKLFSKSANAAYIANSSNAAAR